MKNILMIGAHYDDVELGCAGTALKLIEQGCNVYKITLTDNEFEEKNYGFIISKSESTKSSIKSCDFLGIKELDFKQQKYGELSYNKAVMQEIENIIIDLKIDTVFFHHKSDMHHDHEVAYEISKTAARHCNNIFTYQSNGYILDNAFAPNLFFDITDQINKKIKALNFYDENQKEQNRQGRLFDICIKRNEIWGYGNHVGYAEGFQVIKYML